MLGKNMPGESVRQQDEQLVLLAAAQLRSAFG
jgi:hypothetical protein